MRIKKGDKVHIMRGKDRGKNGVVMKVFPGEARVTVEGVNLYRKRVRPRRPGQKGETVLVARPLSASNVALVCGSCKRPVRIGIRMQGERKERYCKKCGAGV
jgi:large subunit ribosomal protein L24